MGPERSTSRAVIAVTIVCDLCASSGEEIVRRVDTSRFIMYTSFCFSTAAVMMARPLGSTARYWPGTMRRQPDLPGKKCEGHECRFEFMARYQTFPCAGAQMHFSRAGIQEPPGIHRIKVIGIKEIGYVTSISSWAGVRSSTKRPESEPTTR